jgi:uracil phosphoribosyltransferase
MSGLHVVGHPLAAHLLAGLRDERTEPERFRHLAGRLATVLTLDATRDLPTAERVVRTPLEDATARVLDREVTAVPILRAGLGLLGPVTDLLPDVRVGYVGLERDDETLQPSSYYLNVPPLAGGVVLLLDPMLATGGSAAFAAGLLTEHGADDIRLVTIVSAPEGIARVRADAPRVRIITAAVDRGLDERGFIVPGLGDAGDRLFGTVAG